MMLSASWRLSLPGSFMRERSLGAELGGQSPRLAEHDNAPLAMGHRQSLAAAGGTALKPPGLRSVAVSDSRRKGMLPGGPSSDCPA